MALIWNSACLLWSLLSTPFNGLRECASSDVSVVSRIDPFV